MSNLTRRTGAALSALVLLGAAAAAEDAKTDFASELKQLNAESKQAQDEYVRPYREAKTDEDRQKLPPYDPSKPAAPFVEKYLDFARRAKGTEPGLGACQWLFSRAPQDDAGNKAADEALKLAVEDGLDLPAMGNVAWNLRYAAGRLGEGRVVGTLRTIAEKSVVPGNRGAAMFNLGALFFDDEHADAAKKAEAHKLFEKVVKDHADTPWGPKARGYLNEMDLLQVGMTVPDFTATDSEGKSFKLSDYRGKVVVLDFWGFW